mmetsp:Transcript_1513/g.2285  ORF Transcript_1513/g.2285 Transcript_1513/m.2285 type:complete len:255 (-) Transcript_1513:38-802(-)|eukprot:CAMPEP_0197244010 /NCGR_PEP_ID=MMETSP1429-20130617/9270_1 /TAXON_ID=49237 /ORGANISM="Chaetoceros  sp., Strain UNC1202" /LENGTH=254 /DNA_ID=CAMNT_0042704307 /DNA_START=57 /DNA_END=821 /DNA_ORIENTATION=+
MADTAPPTTSVQMNEPNQTLYIANIDWKVKKQVLKRALHTLFNRHGKILDIVALRKDGLRGQAFVIFDNVSSATAALQAEQDFTFFGKDLQIQYAREKSDRIAKKDGTFVAKDRKAKREAKEAAIAVEQAAKRVKMEALSASNLAVVSVNDPSTLVKEDAGPVVPAVVAPVEKTSNEPTPSNILFADSLPEDCNEMVLKCLFSSYSGFKEVRIPRVGLAFIEFDEEPHSSIALKALNGFKLSATDTLNLKYGKS